MSGIYDRIGVAEDNVPVHFLSNAIVLYSEGIFTKPQILSAINELVTTSMAGDEITDLQALADGVDAEVGVQNKIRYLLRFQALAEAKERGVTLIDETVFRAQLSL